MSDICLVRDKTFLNHDPGFPHPENPKRLQTLYAKLEANAALAALPTLKLRSATEKEVLRVHAQEMWTKLIDSRGKTGWFDTDTYYTPDTANTTLLAVGAHIELALSIWKGKYRRGFTLTRPPGHHATKEQAMGFCPLNATAIAVAAIQAENPQARLAVVDFDLHHGNGTQWLFYDNPNVLFISSHRYPFYPGTGALQEVGAGKGKGTTVNLPIGEAEGEGFFLPLYQQVTIPILRAFAPDMLLISAGFDGHFLDPMQGFRLQTSTYQSFAQLLLSVAEERNGKILFLLEGGYNPDALADSAIAVLEEIVRAPRKAFSPTLTETENAKVEPFLTFHEQYFPEIGK